MKVKLSQLRQVICEKMRRMRMHGGEYDYAMLPDALLDSATESISKTSKGVLKGWEYSKEFKVTDIQSDFGKRSSAIVSMNTPRGEMNYRITITPVRVRK